MNDIQKRTALLKIYPTKTWADKVKKMSELQVTAIYLRQKSLGNVR